MGKSELKTKKNDADVAAFIAAVPDETRRRDAETVTQLMTEITGEQPKMWGSSIIGFAEYHYKSERSKQEGDWPRIGLSPRKASLTLYFMSGFDGFQKLLGQLGKHRISKGCLYIKDLQDVDMGVLREMISKSYKQPPMGTV